MLKQGGLFAPISREGALVLNNLFLTTACADRVRRHALSAGARGAHRRQDLGRRAVLQSRPSARCSCRCCSPCRSGRCWPGSAATSAASAQRLMAAFAVGLVVIAATLCASRAAPVLAPFGVGARLLRHGRRASIDLVERTGAVPRAARDRRCARARGLPRSAWGTAFAHAGLGADAARHHRRDAPGAPSTSSRSSRRRSIAICRLRSDLRGPGAAAGAELQRSRRPLHRARRRQARSASWSRRSAPSRARHDAPTRRR